jgi:CheY-like chemotaxis protein/HPt (histidine-containing phosphotransfer) domain-containing protein
VAEDNPTNRDVIGRQLKVLGYTFEMADDGALALAAWENDDFGMLLTDCHMPNMDGFELTAKIREHEVKSKPEERFPIVAITANALQGEAEICLAAGMDGYLSKPINLRDLARTLKQWLPEDDTDASAETATVGEHQGGRQLEESSKGSSVDISALKGLIGDDEEMLREVLQDFIEPSLDIIDEIKAGHSARSAERVKQAAHKLKSSARSIGANALAELCLVLETAGKDNDLERINVEVVKIDEAMGAVCKYIEAL